MRVKLVSINKFVKEYLTLVYLSPKFKCNIYIELYASYEKASLKIVAPITVIIYSPIITVITLTIRPLLRIERFKYTQTHPHVNQTGKPMYLNTYAGCLVPFKMNHRLSAAYFYIKPLSKSLKTSETASMSGPKADLIPTNTN